MILVKYVRRNFCEESIFYPTVISNICDLLSAHTKLTYVWLDTSVCIKVATYLHPQLYTITDTEDDVLKDDDSPDTTIGEGPKTIT